MLRGLVASAVVVGALFAVSSVAAAQELDDAREQMAGIEEQLASTTERYERTRAAIETTVEQLEQLEGRSRELRTQAIRLDERLVDRARDVFMHGSSRELELLLVADGPDAAIARANFAAALQERDAAGLQEAVATRTALDQVGALTAERRNELERLEAELAGLETELERELEAAKGRVRSVEQLEERRRTIHDGEQSGTYACPMDPAVTQFVDSWGFPRSGGRSHQGTDVMGPMGAEVYALTAGVISRHSNGGLGGTSLYLRGDDGSTYYYAHLQGYTSRGAVGTRVSAGEHIAYNGDTGNARGGAPHIHLERHPGGGSPVNPYGYLAAACY